MTKTNVCPYYEAYLQTQQGGKSSLWRKANKVQLNQSVSLAPGMDSAGLGGLQIPQAGSTEHTIERPIRAPDLASDVGVPVALSFVTGAMVAAPIFTIMIGKGQPIDKSVLICSIIGMIVMVVMWFYKMGTFDSLLWFVETVTHTDINQDDNVGKPEPAPPIKLHIDKVREDGSAQYLNLTLPAGVTDAMFRDWAGQVISEAKSTGRNDWTGRGNPFGRKLYDDFLAVMIDGGIVADNKDGKGRVLTPKGKSSLARMLARTGG